jgi:WD40 repeat protein
MVQHSMARFSITISVLLLLAFSVAGSQAEELELVLQAGHRLTVRDSVWLDNEHLVSGSTDGSIILWHAPTQRVKRTLWPPSQGPEAPTVNDLVKTPQGVWAIYSNGELVLWDIPAGKILKKLDLPGERGWGEYKSVADKNGRLIVFDRDQVVYDVALDGKISVLNRPYVVKHLSISSDGERIAFVDHDGIHPSLESPENVLPKSFANRWGVDFVLLDSTGDRLYVGTSVNWLEGWDLKTGQAMFRVPINKDAPDEATLKGQGYSAENLGVLLADYDGEHLLVHTSDGQVQLANKSDGKLTALTAFPDYGLTTLDVNPDRTALSGAFNSGASHAVPIVSKEQGKWVSHHLGGQAQSFYQLEKADEKLYMATIDNVLSFDLATGQPYRAFETGYFPAFATARERIFCGGNDGVLTAYDTTTGRKLWSKDLTSEGARIGYGVQALALHPSGTKIAVSVSQSRPFVAVLDTATGETEIELSFKVGTKEVLFSSDGSQLFLSQGRELNLYDMNYRKVLHTWEIPGRKSAYLVDLLNHPLEDSVLALDTDGLLVKLNRHRLDVKPESIKLQGVPGPNSFRAEGDKLLIAAGKSAYLCSTKGELLKTYGRHLTQATDAIIIDEAVLTTGWDSRVQIWSREDGSEQAILLALDEGREWLVLAPDYHFDGSDGAQGLIEWRWNEQLFEVSRFFERFYQPGLLAQVLRPGQKASAPPSKPVLGSQPPKVSLLPPKPLGNGEYEVEIQVDGEHSGDGDIRLYHNGHRVAGSPPYKIKAVEGKNRLRASAFNTDKTVESVPSRLTFESDVPPQKSTLYIFAAAVNDYPNPLDFAVEDAKSFVAAFVPGLYDDVKKVTLLDKHASKEAILKALGDLDCQPQDTLLVFLAGHGTIIDNRFHYLPYGSDGEKSEGALSSRELGNILAELPATRQVLFLDTCHAGASAKDMADLLVDKKEPLLASQRGSQIVRDQKLLARQAGTFLVAGSTPNATAAEVPELGHGIFTYAVLNGLRDKNSTEDQQITVNELLRYLNQKVPELSMKFRGSPHGIWQFSAGQDFPIAKP